MIGKMIIAVVGETEKIWDNRRSFKFPLVTTKNAECSSMDLSGQLG